MAEFSVTSWQKQGAMIVSFGGAIKTHDVPAVNTEIAKILHEYFGRPEVIVLDLSKLSMMCSMFIGSLIKLNKGLKAAGGRTIGVEAPPAVFAVAKVVYLDKLLPFEPTLDRALAASGATSA